MILSVGELERGFLCWCCERFQIQFLDSFIGWFVNLSFDFYIFSMFESCLIVLEYTRNSSC